MKKSILILFVLFSTIVAKAQTPIDTIVVDSFMLVGSFGTPTALTDSTWRVNIDLYADAFGKARNGTQVQTGFYAMDGKRQIYEIIAVNSSGATEVNVDIKRRAATNTAPILTAIIWQDLTTGLIPVPPVGGASGISSVMQSAILQHNALQTATNVDNLTFNSNRPILRLWEVGDNIGGSTIQEFLSYIYFTPPTISVTISPSTTVYEIGDSSQVIATATTTNSGGATLSAGSLVTSWSGGSENVSYGAATTARDTIQFAPTQGGATNYNRSSYSWQATQAWVSGAESGTATSNTRTVQGVYPVLYGVSATDYSASGNIYGAAGFSKLVQTEGNKSVTFTGTGFLYYAIPTTWGDVNLASIIDHNGFNVTASFTAYDITVSSSGLTNDWSGVSYKLYKLNTSTTASGFTYQFNR